MKLRQQFLLLASYNQWMNEKLYLIAESLPQEKLFADGGAFFGSVFGTLNHIAVGDRIWLQRFANHPSCQMVLNPVAQLPKPETLDLRLFDTMGQLAEHRRWLDGLIIDWIDHLTESDLDYVLHYHNTAGKAFHRRFASLLMHFFNHQTHHRGQVTALLSDLGCDYGVTDLLALISDEH